MIFVNIQHFGYHIFDWHSLQSIRELLWRESRRVDGPIDSIFFLRKTVQTVSTWMFRGLNGYVFLDVIRGGTSALMNSICILHELKYAKKMSLKSVCL